MAFKYPYGNSQQLNLDWLINAWRQFQQQIENNIAPPYNDNLTYAGMSLVIYNHQLYYNPDDIEAPEEFNPEHWVAISIADIFMGNI